MHFGLTWCALLASCVMLGGEGDNAP
jgi:hypothetical protein